MAWFSLLSYLGKNNDAHSGKESRSAQVGEWLPTLMGQPIFDALEPSRPQSPRASMHSGSRLANGMRLPFVA
jgi:hypothetical protein